MTICVACIYNNNAILGASDRMLTATDIQFEPPTRKIRQITNSIALMIAGDTNLHTEIFNRLIPRVNAQIDSNPAE
jgi:20S proteasome alpha/beta subunit